MRRRIRMTTAAHLEGTTGRRRHENALDVVSAVVFEKNGEEEAVVTESLPCCGCCRRSGDVKVSGALTARSMMVSENDTVTALHRIVLRNIALGRFAVCSPGLHGGGCRLGSEPDAAHGAANGLVSNSSSSSSPGDVFARSVGHGLRVLQHCVGMTLPRVALPPLLGGGRHAIKGGSAAYASLPCLRATWVGDEMPQGPQRGTPSNNHSHNDHNDNNDADDGNDGPVAARPLDLATRRCHSSIHRLHVQLAMYRTTVVPHPHRRCFPPRLGAAPAAGFDPSRPVSQQPEEADGDDDSVDEREHQDDTDATAAAAAGGGGAVLRRHPLLAAYSWCPGPLPGNGTGCGCGVALLDDWRVCRYLHRQRIRVPSLPFTAALIGNVAALREYFQFRIRLACAMREEISMDEGEMDMKMGVVGVASKSGAASGLPDGPPALSRGPTILSRRSVSVGDEGPPPERQLTTRRDGRATSTAVLPGHFAVGPMAINCLMAGSQQRPSGVLRMFADFVSTGSVDNDTVNVPPILAVLRRGGEVVLPATCAEDGGGVRYSSYRSSSGGAPSSSSSSSSSFSVLHAACIGGDPATVAFLVAGVGGAASVLQTLPPGETRKGMTTTEVSKAKRMAEGADALENGAGNEIVAVCHDVLAQDEHGWAPVHFAAFHRRVEALAYLFDEYMPPPGWEHPGALLLDDCADHHGRRRVDSRERRRSPASSSSHQDVSGGGLIGSVALRQCWRDTLLSVKTTAGWTIQHLAAVAPATAAVASYVSPTPLSSQQYYPFAAVEHESDGGGDEDDSSSSSSTLALLRLLEAAGASFEEVDLQGQTPLHIACREGRTAVATFLVEANRRWHHRQHIESLQPTTTTTSGSTMRDDAATRRDDGSWLGDSGTRDAFAQEEEPHDPAAPPLIDARDGSGMRAVDIAAIRHRGLALRLAALGASLGDATARRLFANSNNNNMAMR